MTAHVLVTGGAGFIGSHLVDELLQRRFHVTVFDNLATGLRANVHPDATFIHGDVRNKAALLKTFENQHFDAICHIAGQASISLSYANPAADLSVNVEGTLNVLHCAIAHKTTRLLYASSMTVYGNPTVVPTPESAAPSPVSYYGVTKLAAEQYVHLCAARTDLTTPLAVTTFRMFNVYGPRQSLSNPYQGVLAIFLGNIKRREPITIHSDGEQMRDFVYVRDVVRAWADALDHPGSAGVVYNLGSGSPTSINTLCDTMLSLHGYSRSSYPIHTLPAQQGDIRASAADISRLSSGLGWYPEVSLEQGMAKPLEWARSQEA